MMRATTVKVSSRHQISLPSSARKQLDIDAGDRLLVDIQDGVIVLIPQPKDYVKTMAGLRWDIWRDTDTAVYLAEERAAWQTSDDD